MPAIREFSLQSPRSATAKRRLLIVLTGVAIAFTVLLVREFGLIGLALPPALALIGATSALRQSARDLKLSRADHLQPTLRILRSLHGSDFEEARRQLDDLGHVVSSTRVRLVDPRTWLHPQRVMDFECWPFEVTITEKFSRVVQVQVTIDEEKAG